MRGRCAAERPRRRPADHDPDRSRIGHAAAHYFAGHARQTLLLAGTGGFGLLARVGDLLSRQKGGKSFLSLEPGEKPLPPALVDGCDKVACLSLAGRLLLFGLDELKLQANGGRGLTLIDLDASDALVSVAAFVSGLQLLGSGRGGKAKEELLRGPQLAGYTAKRARKGKAVSG